MILCGSVCGKESRIELLLSVGAGVSYWLREWGDGVGSGGGSGWWEGGVGDQDGNVN